MRILELKKLMVRIYPGKQLSDHETTPGNIQSETSNGIVLVVKTFSWARQELHWPENLKPKKEAENS